MTNNQQVTTVDTLVLRQAPQPPNHRKNMDSVQFDIVRDDNEFLMFEPERNDDFTFEKLHEEFGRPILQAMSERRALKEKAEVPLIFL